MVTGSEPEKGPQKSNYRSSREGVGLNPQAWFQTAQSFARHGHTRMHTHTHISIFSIKKNPLMSKEKMAKKGDEQNPKWKGGLLKKGA